VSKYLFRINSPLGNAIYLFNKGLLFIGTQPLMASDSKSNFYPTYYYNAQFLIRSISSFINNVVFNNTIKKYIKSM
jgi:hypothetical protein